METSSHKIVLGGWEDVLSSPSLLRAHWIESAKNKELMVLNPNVDVYKLLDKAGVLLTLLAYVDDEIVGYSANIIHSSLHYQDLMMCTNDVIFVLEEHRNSSLGARLIKRTEEEARERGAEIILWHAKEDTSLDKILSKSKKYKVQDVIYSKQL